MPNAGRWGSWRELLVAAKDSFWGGGRAEPGSEYCFATPVATPAAGAMEKRAFLRDVGAGPMKKRMFLRDVGAAPMKKRVFLHDFLGSYRLGAPPQWHFAGCLRPFARFGPRVLWPGS